MIAALPAADWIGLALLSVAVLIVAAIAIAEFFFTDKGTHAAPHHWPQEAAERLADTDTRTAYRARPRRIPPTPILAAPVDDVDPVGPRVVPDTPRTCRCGGPAGHFRHRLETVPLEDLAAMFDTVTFGAVA